MKGQLIKTEKGWVVNYHYSVNKNDWETLPLHPDFIEMMDTCFTSKFSQEVEFEIVYVLHTDNQTDQNYAKLLHHIVDPNEMINHIGDANKMVEDDVWKVGLEDELNKLPYTKHLDDGQYNDGQLAGFELGAEWGFNKAKETLYTEEQIRMSFEYGKSLEPFDSFEDFIQSLKQRKQ